MSYEKVQTWEQKAVDAEYAAGVTDLGRKGLGDSGPQKRTDTPRR